VTSGLTPGVTAAVLEFAGVSKDYRGLRPLRIAELLVGAGDRVALLGFDQVSAEVFVNLATGATLPDAGEVRIFGRATHAIDDSADWLATVDRFGIVSERAVLLDGLTVIQNLAMPFTLEIEPPPEDVRVRAEALAREVGLPEAVWSAPVAGLGAAGWLRVRFGRAIALDPAILLLEHASARLGREEVAALGHEMRAVAAARGIALLAVTADEVFAQAVSARVLTLEPATGRLKEPRRRWFR
jgi:predicted ABC-type transport system involved in lysophospholipase L1 biosynthesis ATPase subunit